jgi:diguanylate cyclase (GGDEF)-like protein
MRGSVLLWDEGQEQLQVRVTRGRTFEGLAVTELREQCCRTFALGEGIAGRVFESGQAEVVHQIGRDPGFVGQLIGVQSMICTPLRVEGETLGVLCLVKGEGQVGFLDSDLHLVGALANQAAMALYKTRLHELATRDGLTRMLTRRFFMRRLKDELKRAQRFERPVALVLIDVDRFKQINDSRGHLVGDAVLQAVSSLLRANIRDEIDVLGRYGGDEFALILPETDAEGARVVSERLLDKVRDLVIHCQGGSARVTLSMGVAAWPEGGQDCLSLLQSADEALYVVKERGRDGVAVYQEGP